ncbi:unnamed protein product [Triticum turgidum subsp. durum]|uniref:RRM domain-containing protein n=1 Tax=Triticum turgidum subsp. durum TaxID=4567 RepID=A0A9R0WGX2_TRITD|nr:unnamed protein product [Triticum turgidum subsp. durum]
MVRVRNILDLAGEREVREFLSFFGEIEHVDISPDVVATGRTAYATFKDVEGPRDNAAALGMYGLAQSSNCYFHLCSGGVYAIWLCWYFQLLSIMNDSLHCQCHC